MITLMQSKGIQAHAPEATSEAS